MATKVEHPALGKSLLLLLAALLSTLAGVAGMSLASGCRVNLCAETHYGGVQQTRSETEVRT